MARRIVWAPKASKDFLAAIDFIAADAPANARRVADRVLRRVESLATMATGRPGRVADTYEAYVLRTSLIIAFELPDKSTINILRIIHAKRNWPEGEWPEQ
jgi:toxin ParE1/3/4